MSGSSTLIMVKMTLVQKYLTNHNQSISYSILLLVAGTYMLPHKSFKIPFYRLSVFDFTIIIWETLTLRINFAITIVTVINGTEIESCGGQSGGRDSSSY